MVGRASGGATAEQLSVHEPRRRACARIAAGAARDGETGYGWGMYNQNAAAGDHGRRRLRRDRRSDRYALHPRRRSTAAAAQLAANARYNIFGRGPKVWVCVRDGVVDPASRVRRRALATSLTARPSLTWTATACGLVGNVYNCGADPERITGDAFNVSADHPAAGGQPAGQPSH